MALARQTGRLRRAFEDLAVRHWWSFKTLPLRPAIQWWKSQGLGVEVVSEFEWRGALKLGFGVDWILVNGPAKHAWLAEHARDGMRVNFDSLNEIRALAAIAKRRRWRIGVRFNTSSEVNPEYPGVRTPFGLVRSELGEAARLLGRAGLKVELAHFHLRTNVAVAAAYREAAEEVLGMGADLGWRPEILDLGGGLPAAGVRDRAGKRLESSFSWGEMRRGIGRILAGGAGVGLREVWMENGRWLTAPTGVLAVRVLDNKEGRGRRTLTCDGGRTLHAMVSTWERHDVEALERRRGPQVRTMICGPTCMAFDNLGEHRLPAVMRPGDVLIWRDAGAYQICWETRFSHGLAPVTWCGRKGVEVVRAAESFEGWWAGR
jgi:diaminopimelate decarboxylase